MIHLPQLDNIEKILNKKNLIISGIALLVLALATFGTIFFFIKRKKK
ncbi:MAG TPA: hypothetical protein PLG34_04990 [Spirochaetota bacterium]|jgi:hypothetical protein|nr:MAG: hypothetical protein BWX91_02421 [Spirochaetes bacterium ADurb.Bin133]HNZ27358.1 hypothetical protein [Spirochaetota bacterium]HPY87318.1 hypothetical protein [Spirochaetota bacterium]HQB61213.1 hypothetical protein [Spirochaetota bacterium]